MRTDEELKQLTGDILNGSIFTSQHCDPSMVTSVFMPLALMEPEKLKNWVEENKAAVVFEYTHKATPRGINGMPMFVSCQSLTQEEWGTVVRYYNEMRDSKAKAASVEV